MRRMIGGLLAAVALVMMAAQATADDDNDCNIDLKHDIRVSAERVAVSDGEQALFDIEQGGELTVREQPVALTLQQRELVETYGGELSALIPQVIELVSSALALAGSSVSTAFNEAFGEDSTSGDKLAAALMSLYYQRRQLDVPAMGVEQEEREEAAVL